MMSLPSSSDVKFQNYAIILIEPKPKNTAVQQNHDDSPATEETWAKTLFSKKLKENYQDVGQLSKILEEKIQTHTGVEASTFTAHEIIQGNAPVLVPLMFRIAVEDFAKNCKSQFKIIQCRHETKLSSDWKPSLPDILIARKHQVIIVDLKEAFLPHMNLADAILRQLNHEWRIKLPQSLFYPNDVCTMKENSPEKSLIMLTPSMPDGDLKLSRLANQQQRNLLKMFKRSCMNALKNTLRMKDLGIAKLEEIVSALARIRTIYRRVQRCLLLRQKLLIEPESCQKLINQMASLIIGNLTTSTTVMVIGQRLFKLGKLPKLPPLNCDGGQPNVSESLEKQVSSTMTLDGGGDRLLLPTSKSKSSTASSIRKELPSSSNSTKNVEGEKSLPEQFALLDQKLKSKLEKIESMLSVKRNASDVGKKKFEESRNKSQPKSMQTRKVVGKSGL